ncbi:MAG: SulP family inorganic anion transporter [Flavobacteriales bacterium]|nr:SulP family inorganic anion transporter [Flavobacteriales bacterium]
MFKHLGRDLPSSIVVFLVALPLCLGIALASGAPPLSGLIAGIVCGIVVGALSGSPLGVSGPAAGLAVIVLNGIESLPSLEIFAVAVMIGGLVQVVLGVLRAGIIGLYFPSSVIQGMLAAIGIIIFLKQLPHAVGFDEEPEGSLQFASDATHNTASDLAMMFESFQPTAILVSLIGLGLLLFWETAFMKRQSWSQFLPASLWVVGIGVVINVLTKGTGWELSADHLVQVPMLADGESITSLWSMPDFSALGRKDVWTLGITLAIVASLETLLCVEATDKMDPHQRVTPPNRELFAQGAGNLLSGFLGGLPVTQVIVRSSANIQSGGQTKLSAIVHGFWLLLAVFVLPEVLNMIPLASLAAILLVVGYKLAKPATFVRMAKHGGRQFIPFVITVLAIVMTDLLTGIGIGLAAAVVAILWDHYKRPLEGLDRDDNAKRCTLTLGREVTFLHKAGIRQALAELPEDYHVEVDARASQTLDPDVVDILEDFQKKTQELGLDFVIHR